MDVIQGAPRLLEFADPLRPVVQLLVDPTPRFGDAVPPVTAALERAAALPREERWGR